MVNRCFVAILALLLPRRGPRLFVISCNLTQFTPFLTILLPRALVLSSDPLSLLLQLQPIAIMSDVPPRGLPVPPSGASSPRVSASHNVRIEMDEDLDPIAANRSGSAFGQRQSSPRTTVNPSGSGPPSSPSFGRHWGQSGASGLGVSFDPPTQLGMPSRRGPGSSSGPHGSPPRLSSGPSNAGVTLPPLDITAWGKRAGFGGSSVGLPPIRPESSIFSRPAWAAGSPPTARGPPSSRGPLPPISTADTLRARAASLEGATLSMPRSSTAGSSRAGKAAGPARKPNTRASARAQSAEQPRLSGSPPIPSPLRSMETASSLPVENTASTARNPPPVPEPGLTPNASVDPAVGNLLSTVLPDELRRQLELYASADSMAAPGVVRSRPRSLAAVSGETDRGEAGGPPVVSPAVRVRDKPAKKATGPSRSKKAVEKTAPSKPAKRPAPVVSESPRRLRSRVGPGPEGNPRGSGRGSRATAAGAAPPAAGAAPPVAVDVDESVADDDDGPHTPQEVHHADVEQLPNPRGLTIRPYSTPCLTCVKVIAQDPTKTCTFKGPYKSCLECSAKHLGYCQAVRSSSSSSCCLH